MAGTMKCDRCGREITGTYLELTNHFENCDGAKPKKKRNKYGSKPTRYNGIRYHSIKEARQAEKNDYMVQSGDIDFWVRQPRIVLAPGLELVPDFILFQPGWQEYIKICDTKGFTKERRWLDKIKMLAGKYPGVVIEEI